MEKIDQTSFEELRKDNAHRLHELDVLAGGGDLRGTETTERTIRAGIDRFCRGTTQTDGSWTVVNLVEETGVPRPTLYRYKRELELFQNLGASAPHGGAREELKRLRSELAAEREVAKAERARHRNAEAVLVERIHALSLLVASTMGEDSLPRMIELSNPPE